MSFKLRNTLILAAQFLIIAAVGGYLMLFHFPKKLEAMTREHDQLNRQLIEQPRRAAEIEKLKVKIEQDREKLAKIDKVVVPDTSLAGILRYLDMIQHQYGDVKFQLGVESKGDGKKQDKDGSRGKQRLSLTGEGRFPAVLGLVWALENGPRYFSIEQLNLRGAMSTVTTENEEPGPQKLYVPFTIKLETISREVRDVPRPELSLASVPSPRKSNPFQPLILQDIPPNYLGLLEVERAELKAILPDKVIIADFTGSIQTLRVGDEVYLGYLTAIDQDQNLADFTLNKGGIVEKFQLKLPFQAQAL